MHCLRWFHIMTPVGGFFFVKSCCRTGFEMIWIPFGKLNITLLKKWAYRMIILMLINLLFYVMFKDLKF